MLSGDCSGTEGEGGASLRSLIRSEQPRWSLRKLYPGLWGMWAGSKSECRRGALQLSVENVALEGVWSPVSTACLAKQVESCQTGKDLERKAEIPTVESQLSWEALTQVEFPIPWWWWQGQRLGSETLCRPPGVRTGSSVEVPQGRNWEKTAENLCPLNLLSTTG